MQFQHIGWILKAASLLSPWAAAKGDKVVTLTTVQSIFWNCIIGDVRDKSAPTEIPFRLLKAINQQATVVHAFQEQRFWTESENILDELFHLGRAF